MLHPKRKTTPGCTECGVEKTLRIVGSKWTMNILHNLFDGKKRFGELQKLLLGISTKTLSVRLQELEKEKIISKKIFAEVPLHVEYSLTQRGRSLDNVFKKMAQWGENGD